MSADEQQVADEPVAEPVAEEPVVAVAPGFEPAAGLMPLMQSTVPVNVTEKVAFREDHERFPGMYGLVKAIGYQDGHTKLDVLVFDPFHGVREDDADNGTHARITLAEIQ